MPIKGMPSNNPARMETKSNAKNAFSLVHVISSTKMMIQNKTTRIFINNIYIMPEQDYECKK